MRIVSYNILDGGEGRADPLAEVMIAQRADVVALVEADDLTVLERIAARLKMDFIHAPGHSHASSLLSRWPIRETINHVLLRKGISKSLLEATVEDPAGGEWTIGVVHLHARATESDEDARQPEIDALLDVFKSHREAKRRHVLAGDFNSNSPVQQINPDRCKPRTREEWKANGGQLPRRAIQKIMDAGYIDSLLAHDATAASNIGTFSTQYPGQRVDYIFSFGSSGQSVRSAWIEQDRLAKYASDHFPVGAEVI